MSKWSLAQAVEVAKRVEAICPRFGCHVALTGGCLYKDGERKDLDLLFYRIRQVETIDYDGLFLVLTAIGFTLKDDFSWVRKAVFEGKSVDLLFPERTPDGAYSPMDEAHLLDLEEPHEKTIWFCRAEKTVGKRILPA